MSNKIDVVDFCSDLVRCKSITPADDGAIDYIAKFLKQSGFEIHVLEFIEGDRSIKNLFAEYLGNAGGKKLGFLGHSDVVPEGIGWSSDPFDPIQKDGYLIGRGVADMKGGVSAFCCAVARFIKETSFAGSISVFITGDEEVGSYQGIQSLLNWAKNKIPDDCLIGEPSSDVELGDRIYIGHRGSMNVTATAIGKQGHSAYPQNYDNALTRLCRFITAIKDYQWKHEDKRFPITNAEPTLIFGDNVAENVVPGTASANINVRFGADYSFNDLQQVFFEQAQAWGIELKFKNSGEAYCCEDENLKNILSAAIKKITGLTAKFSTAGGTSDGRYMIKHCNIIEFGLQDATIHKANEKAKIADLVALENVYLESLRLYFGA